MKIFYISDAKSIHTKRWALYFAENGYEVHIASFRDEIIPGVKVHKLSNFGIGKLGYFLAINQLKKIYNELLPDIVHAQHLTSYGFLAALSNLQPLLVTAWGSDILLNPKKSIISRIFVQYTLKKAKKVTTVAEHMNKEVFKYCSSCKDVEAITFGVDIDKFELDLRISDEDINIISTRNFAEVYSVDTLILAIDVLQKKGFSPKVKLVGDGPLKEELKKLVKELNLESIITFYGHVDENKLISLLQESDIFISSAISDGNNVSLNEAMACGCFPIATDIPANSQWIEDAENGFLFQNYNFEELAEKILLVNSTLKKDAKHINRIIVEEKANWKIATKRMEELYMNLKNNN